MPTTRRHIRARWRLRQGAQAYVLKTVDPLDSAAVLRQGFSAASTAPRLDRRQLAPDDDRAELTDTDGTIRRP
jgi:hypothetical protein